MLREALVLAAVAFLPATALADEPVSVMIVGGFHMSNPGHDLHNVQVDDVLAPKRQSEIAAVTTALAKFKPTMVAVEWPSDLVNQRYDAYLKGTLAPSHNEVVQLGFRLAKQAALARVDGIDVDGDFPYDPVVAYAKAHGQEGLLTQANAEIEAAVQAQDDLLANGSVGHVLRYLNDPGRVAGGNAFYRLMLKVGGGGEQPGAELLTQWYRRNFLICANLVQRTKPGDHVVVFYGAGHGFLLRQCVSETPGFKLVEANGYLPQ
ncbi:MAG TPA: DUF5694 domain-containing protein [Rhizomicrobium sp.]|nr:DUF5694 domain-containing protein [Rhizomicrobium sp.]